MKGRKRLFCLPVFFHDYVKRLLKSKFILIERRVPLQCSSKVTMEAGERQCRHCQGLWL